MANGRIEARVTPEHERLAERIAKARKFTLKGGKPNVSQLVRILIEEEAERLGIEAENGTVGPSEGTNT